MQDQIAQMLVCAAGGCALSLVLAAAMTGSGARRSVRVMLPRLVIAGGPAYLAADYVFYQGAVAAACAAAGLGLGLWALRGWWLPLAPAPHAAAAPG
ncbi:MAG: hypothetical protein JO258_20720, partial [Alphaproteobacteria bacterium]|nr:hypothetical protein [Alphaproteobacteria bacterium]